MPDKENQNNFEIWSECKKKQVAAYTAWMARGAQFCWSPSEFVYAKIPLPLLPLLLGGTAQPLTGLDLLQKKNNNMPLLSVWMEGSWNAFLKAQKSVKILARTKLSENTTKDLLHPKDKPKW